MSDIGSITPYNTSVMYCVSSRLLLQLINLGLQLRDIPVELLRSALQSLNHRRSPIGGTKRQSHVFSSGSEIYFIQMCKGRGVIRVGLSIRDTPDRGGYDVVDLGPHISKESSELPLELNAMRGVKGRTYEDIFRQHLV